MSLIIEGAAVATVAAGSASILGYIDTSVKVASFLISERLPATVQNIVSFFSRKKITKPAYFNESEAKDFVAFLVIDTDTLIVIGDLISNAIKNYNECLKKAARAQESDACDRRAEKAICDSLNRIMDRNKDVLPGEYLRNQWDSFRCARI